MMERLGIRAAEITPETTLVCTRASDFNPADNVLWEDPANRSAVRPDVACDRCKQVVAMSRYAYERWSAMDRKPGVLCPQCVVVSPGS